MRASLSAISLTVLALLAACDSGSDTPDIFSALEGDWVQTDSQANEALRFGPRDGFALVRAGIPIARGRIGVGYVPVDGGERDLLGLTSITYTVETGPQSRASTYDTVVSVSRDELVLEGCIVASCSESARRTYRRERSPAGARP